MTVVEVLARLDIQAEETIKGKIVVPDIRYVPVTEEGTFVPIVMRINQALFEAGLLDKWRAKVGGTTDKRWILIVGAR